MHQTQRDQSIQNAYRAFTDGRLSWEAVEAIEAAYRAPAPRPAPAPGYCRPSIFPPKRPQRSPDRQRSIDRRSNLAGSGSLPPGVRKGRTLGEMAVLTVISSAQSKAGDCRLSVEQIAAEAGVAISTVHRARNLAVALGLIVVQRRPVRGQKHQTSVIRVVCPDWLAWMARGIGFHSRNPTMTNKKNKAGTAPATRPERSATGVNRPPHPVDPARKAFRWKD